MEYTRPIGTSYDRKQCPKGHWFDPSITPVCPVCAEEEARATYPAGQGAVPPTGPMNYGQNAVPPTGPVNYGQAKADSGMAAFSEGAQEESRSRNSRQETPQETHSLVDEIDVTRVQSVFGGSRSGDSEGEQEFFNPLVGWLVCTEGPSKGADYRIYSGYNYIGRNPSMDICITGDEYISHDRHAVITFDPRSSRFYFAPVNAKNIVRMNDESVLMPVEVKARDILEIGQTKLMLIPLCDDSFCWK